MLTLTLICLILALVPALLFWMNLRLYAQPPFPAAGQPLPCVEKYLAELEKIPNVEEIIGTEIGNRDVTLLYSARNEDRNNATVLKEFIERKNKTGGSSDG